MMQLPALRALRAGTATPLRCGAAELEPAELVHDPLHGRADLRLLRHVGPKPQRGTSQGPGQLLGLRPVDVDDGHKGAFLAQAASNPRTDSPRTARDQGNLVLQTHHFPRLPLQ
jgi:hypothetical protein